MPALAQMVEQMAGCLIELEEVYATADTPEQAACGFNGSRAVLPVWYGHLLPLSSRSAARQCRDPAARAVRTPAPPHPTLGFSRARCYHSGP